MNVVLEMTGLCVQIILMGLKSILELELAMFKVVFTITKLLKLNSIWVSLKIVV